MAAEYWAWIILGGLFAWFLIVVAIGLAKTVRKSVKPRTTGGTTPGVTKGPLEQWVDSFKDFRKAWVKEWQFYPIYVFVPWFIIVWWIFQAWFPNAFQWLRGDDKTLFWTIPSIMTIIVWIWVYKHAIPRLACLLILFFLGWATWDSFWSSYEKSPTYLQHLAKKETRKIELRHEQEDSSQLKVSVVALPGEWTRVYHIPPGRHVYESDGVYSYKTDQGKVGTDGPDRLEYFGDDVREIRFKSEENRKVNITIRIIGGKS